MVTVTCAHVTAFPHGLMEFVCPTTLCYVAIQYFRHPDVYGYLAEQRHGLAAAVDTGLICRELFETDYLLDHLIGDEPVVTHVLVLLVTFSLQLSNRFVALMKLDGEFVEADDDPGDSVPFRPVLLAPDLLPRRRVRTPALLESFCFSNKSLP